mgnify:CR=1 FL=1
MSPDTLRFQHFPPSAIIGRHQILAREVDLEWCAGHDVAIARRMTGGGAIASTGVYQAPLVAALAEAGCPQLPLVVAGEDRKSVV